MALSIQPELIVMACGSYRRGKQTCGDVDVLITHPDGHSHSGVFTELISRLSATGQITTHLNIVLWILLNPTKSNIQISVLFQLQKLA